MMARKFHGHPAGFAAWLKERPSIRVLDVDDDAMVAEPGPIVAEIDRFPGGGLDVDAIDGSHHRSEPPSRPGGLTAHPRPIREGWDAMTRLAPDSACDVPR
jgi:hypothetical protein